MALTVGVSSIVVNSKTGEVVFEKISNLSLQKEK